VEEKGDERRREMRGATLFSLLLMAKEEGRGKGREEKRREKEKRGDSFTLASFQSLIGGGEGASAASNERKKRVKGRGHPGRPLC